MGSLLAMVLASCTADRPPPPPPAEPPPEVMYQGRLRTPADEQVVEILARDGRIVEIRPWEGTVRPGAFATAGFVDAHAHPASLGRSLAELDLTGVPTYAEALARVAGAPGEGLIAGRGWDQNDWPDAPPGGWPLARDLDRVTPRPVALRRVDGHAVWVDGDALAGLGAATPDPPGGRIVRGPDGAPSGVLVDTAMALVPTPTPSPADLDRQLREALETIAASGLIGVHDMGCTDDDVARYTTFDAAGELRVMIWAYVDPDTAAAERLTREGPWRGDRLEVVGVKLLADGALGSRGALLSADYADEPGHRGAAIATRDEIARWAERLLAVEAQLAVHAIGDQAVHDVLDAFAQARAARPDKAHVPLRLEHAQVVQPSDLARLAPLGVVASMQPTHATSDMPWAEARLGPERVRWAYRWRDVLDAGAVLAFGSDFPVESPNAGLGMWAATTRADGEGHPEGGWHPDQGLTEAEALAAFTVGPWAALGRRVDPLAPGSPAWLSLWMADPAEPSPRWHSVGIVAP